MHGMSNNAVSAYNSGELPASKMAKLLGCKTSDVREFNASSWHHTSKKFNRTDFFRLSEMIEEDFEKVYRMTKKSNRHILKPYLKEAIRQRLRDKLLPEWWNIGKPSTFWTNFKKRCELVNIPKCDIDSYQLSGGGRGRRWPNADDRRPSLTLAGLLKFKAENANMKHSKFRLKEDLRLKYRWILPKRFILQILENAKNGEKQGLGYKTNRADFKTWLVAGKILTKLHPDKFEMEVLSDRVLVREVASLGL